MDYPKAFTDRMNALLSAEAKDFFQSLTQPAQHAFHLNQARVDGNNFRHWLDRQELLKAEAFYRDVAWRFEVLPGERANIGHLPLHHAGAFYSQDPAAMLPLLGLPLSRDLRILDLCAAPGGKSSQLAMAVDGGSGFLLANEPHPGRNRILVSNMERMGYRNVIVVSMSPEELAAQYPEYFDLVLVDAPCSGEGMFRKYPESVREWSLENILQCRERGRTILDAAAHLLRPGGRLIYSTCTFAPEENEEQVDWLCSHYPLRADTAPEAIRNAALSTGPGMYRCYPHLYPGEGQFAAYLKKEGDSVPATVSVPLQLKPLNPQQKSALYELLGEEAAAFPFVSYKERIILLPSGPKRLPERNVTMPGVCVAAPELSGRRLVLHHQFFSAYGNELERKLDLEPEDPRIADYLKGMELREDRFSKGYGAILVSSVPLGGFRAAGGRLKNLYPKGLRE